MMKTRPPQLARAGLILAAVLIGTVACARPGATPTRVPPTPAGPSRSIAATAGTESAAPSLVTSAAPSSPAGTAGSPSPAPATERPGPTPIVGEVKPAPEFVDLVQAVAGSSTGVPFSLADEKGHWTILFFGYTHCPDVCPATLGELVGVLQERPDTRVVFVSIDPERDTPEFLGEWVKYLPAGLAGVTGSPVAIRHAADAYGARYARVDTGSAAGYSMSHTAFQYLIDPEGNLRLTYPFGTPAAAIVGDLDELDRAG
jgi:protein SCO1